MACRNAYENQQNEMAHVSLEENEAVNTTPTEKQERLLFGVNSDARADTVLQNNLTLFDWAERNKLYPNFWGRNIVGEHCLTREEVAFLHDHGCKIAAIYHAEGAKETEEQGKMEAKKIDVAAFSLGIPQGTAIFLEVPDSENVSRDYLKGYAEGLLEEGYVAGFKANTDAKYDFDRAFSQGMQTDQEIFEKCCVWADSPSLEEYDRVTTTHLIHPDNWTPFAPSGITREDIAVWQYGKECHPIQDNNGNETVFNVDLVQNESVVLDLMF